MRSRQKIWKLLDGCWSINYGKKKPQWFTSSNLSIPKLSLLSKSVNNCLQYTVFANIQKMSHLNFRAKKWFKLFLLNHQKMSQFEFLFVLFLQYLNFRAKNGTNCKEMFTSVFCFSYFERENVKMRLFWLISKHCVPQQD